MRNVFAGRKDRHIELPVSSRDLLVVARVIAILALACVAAMFNDGPESTQVALFLVGAAVVEPGLPIFWRFQDSYRQAQMVTDIIVFVLIVAIAPQYYWLASQS